MDLIAYGDKLTDYWFVVSHDVVIGFLISMGNADNPVLRFGIPHHCRNSYPGTPRPIGQQDGIAKTCIAAGKGCNLFWIGKVTTGIASTFNNPILITSWKYVITRFGLMGNDDASLPFRHHAPARIDGPSGHSAIGEAVGQYETKRFLIRNRSLLGQISFHISRGLFGFWL